MASINYAARQISVKIVYYGPGLSGKTTNLQVIHKKTPRDHKSEMVSLATETDRTLFFDFLPLDLGKIKQFDTKFQLYTVPGQVYYNATRKLVLRGVDGVVFVADSGADKIQENLESFQNLEENLAEYGYQRDSVPIIIQYNKRDLPNALPIPELQRHINKYNLPYGEGIAYKGVGVFDTLKQIGKIVIDHLNKKYSRSAPGRAAAPTPPPLGGQGGYPQYAPPAAPAYQAPPPAAPSYAPPQAAPWEQPQGGAFGNQGYQQPAAPAYQPPPPAAPSYASADDPFMSQNAPSFEMQAPPAHAPAPQPPAGDDQFFMPPQAQGVPSFEVQAPAPQPQASSDFDDIFMVDPSASAAPQAPAAPNAGYQAGGYPQPPFDFEMSPTPPGGTQTESALPGAQTGGGSEFDLESFSKPSMGQTPPQTPASSEFSFDYQPFTPQASDFGTPQPFADVPQPFANTPQPFGDAPQPFADTPQPFGDATQPFANAPQPFGDTPQPFAGAPQPFGGAPALADAAPQGGRSELDLEIEKYQREIEEKQKKMRSASAASASMSPTGAPDMQEMQPYSGSSSDNRHQSQYQQMPVDSTFSEFEAELENGLGRRHESGMSDDDEECPSDSAMFFTSIDRNFKPKKPVKPPVNPAKQKLQQPQKTGFFKRLNKD